MQLEISDELIQKHFSDGQIQGFMNDLHLSRIETIFYLWFFNFVSICQKDLKLDCGRQMYFEFAKGAGKLLKEVDKIH